MSVRRCAPACWRRSGTRLCAFAARAQAETGASELIAIVVADLSNPFYARVVCAAEAAVAAWGFSLVVFNSDEKPEAEKRIISRVRALCCDGLILVPVGGAVSALGRDADSRRIPTVLFGRTLEDDGLDAVTIDNFAASSRRRTT